MAKGSKEKIKEGSRHRSHNNCSSYVGHNKGLLLRKVMQRMKGIMTVRGEIKIKHFILGNKVQKSNKTVAEGKKMVKKCKHALWQISKGIKV